MPAITFFSLLSEGYVLQMMQYKVLFNLINSPHMSQEQAEDFVRNLKLPEEQLDDILEDENIDDVATIKDILG